MEATIQEVPEIITKVKRTALVFAVPIDFTVPRPGMTNPMTELIGESRRYCPGFSGTGVLRGIPLQDQKRIPAFANKLGVSPDSPNFENKVKEFWADFLVNIPFAEIVIKRGNSSVSIDGGMVINASYIEKNNEIHPENIDDYILYELLIKETKRVATDTKYYSEPGSYDFFCISTDKEEARKEQAGELRKNIYLEIAKLYATEDNVDHVRHIVSLASTNFSSIAASKLTRGQALDEITAAAEENPKRLLKILTDKNIPHKAKIKQYYESGQLSRTGDMYYYGNDAIGTINDAVKFFRDPLQARTVQEMDKKLDAYKSLI